MKSQLNLITVALLTLGISSAASAFDFGVQQANTSKVNQDNWACKTCVQPKGTSGTIAVSVGNLATDDNHAINTLGYEEGFAGAINLQTQSRSSGGVDHQLSSQALGSKHGRLDLEVSRPGQWAFDVSYRQMKQVDSFDATPVVLFDQNHVLVNQYNPALDWDQQQLSTTGLVKNRDIVKVGGLYQGELFGGHLAFEQLDRSGAVRSSYTPISLADQSPMAYNAVNFALPIDQQVQRIMTGLHMKGQAWSAEIGYQHSEFDNEVNASHWFEAEQGQMYMPYSMQNAVDHKAQSVYAQGRFGSQGASGSLRVALTETEVQGMLETWHQNQLNAQPKVDQFDVQLRLAKRHQKIYTTVSYDHYQREYDQSASGQVTAIYDPVTGELIADSYNQDVTRHQVKVSADYRHNRILKYSGGAGYKLIDRTYEAYSLIDSNNIERIAGITESTEDYDLWGQVRYKAPYDVEAKLKLDYQMRDGSDYMMPNQSGDSVLLSKFNLADKQETGIEVELSQAVDQTISWDLSGRYTLEDYDNSILGLIEVERTSLDASIHYQPTKAFDANLYVSQQWSDNLQKGGYRPASGIWAASTEDTFTYAGVNANYLWADMGLTFRGDYHYAYSDSDTMTSYAHRLGDYNSRRHEVTLATDYQVSKQAVVGVSYQYQRYEDTDYADLPVFHGAGDGIYGLTTMGQMGHNYNAHLVMLNFAYQLK